MTPEYICSKCKSTTNPKSNKGLICKVCYSKKAATWQRNNTEQHRLNQIKSKYNISEEEYKNLLVTQNNLCAICNRPESALGRKGKIKNLAIDHCHTTGKVRGLLCQGCNTSLGKLNEDLEIIKKMITYIESNNNG